MTGPGYFCEFFKRGLTDEEKFWVFDSHPSYFAAIKDELKVWVAENWEGWNNAKPEWFTEDFIAMVPDEFIPVKMDPCRRRSSFMTKGIAAPTNPAQVQPVGFGEP